MLDIASPLLALQTVFQIKYRINILIFQFSLLIGSTRKSFVSILFQELAVDHIEISGHIQLHKFLTDQVFLIICQITVAQSLYLINEIVRNCIHSGQKRKILEFEIEQLNNFSLSFHKSLIFHIPEIHQAVFQFYDIAFHKINKFHRLLFLCQRNFVWKTNSAFDLVIAILAVRNCISQLFVSKKIETHFLDILFSQLRQDMGNIIRKYTVW